MLPRFNKTPVPSYSPVDMSDTEPFIPQNVQKNKEQNNRPSYDSDETAIATARPGRLRWYKRPTLPWVLSTLSLSVVIVALLVHIITVDQFCAPSPYGRYESGFHTDLGNISRSISMSHNVLTNVYLWLLQRPRNPSLRESAYSSLVQYSSPRMGLCTGNTTRMSRCTPGIPTQKLTKPGMT